MARKKGMAGVFDSLLPPDAMQAVKAAAVGAAAIYVTDQVVNTVLPMVLTEKNAAGEKVPKPITATTGAIIRGVAGLVGGGLVYGLAGRKRDLSTSWAAGPMTFAMVKIASGFLAPATDAGAVARRIAGAGMGVVTPSSVQTPVQDTVSPGGTLPSTTNRRAPGLLIDRPAA